MKNFVENFPKKCSMTIKRSVLSMSIICYSAFFNNHKKHQSILCCLIYHTEKFIRFLVVKTSEFGKHEISIGSSSMLFNTSSTSSSESNSWSNELSSKDSMIRRHQINFVFSLAVGSVYTNIKAKKFSMKIN